jgi:hypothetical protein
MSAQVISFHHAKARHIAIAKAARVREIAEDLMWWEQGERKRVAAYYREMGWATSDELRLALESLEEVGR